MTKKNDICTRIKELRTRNGLRQEDVAAILGIVRGTYAAKEAGRNQFVVTELAVLADHFSVSVEWILTGTNEEKKDYLTEDEMRLVKAFRCLDGTQQNYMLMAALDLMTATKKG